MNLIVRPSLIEFRILMHDSLIGDYLLLHQSIYICPRLWAGLKKPFIARNIMKESILCQCVDVYVLICSLFADNILLWEQPAYLQ